MPKQINTYTYGQALVRKFGLKGRFQPVLDETIVPVVNVEQDTPDRQFAACGGQISAATGAANWFGIGNPTSSLVLLRLYSLLVKTDTGVNMQWRVNVTAGQFVGTTLGPQWQDRRIAGHPTGIVRHGSGVVGTFWNQFYSRAAENMQQFPLNITLPPGHTFAIESAPNDVIITAQFLWYEEPITATNL